MKKSLLMFASFALLSGVAYAQEEEVVTSLLVPASAWLVGPTTLDDGSAAGRGMPCVMVNKYSNNVEMRLSGGGLEVLAMALTFQEKSFQKDQSYLMGISFPDQELVQLPAQAFSETTLVIGTEPGKDFYKSLQTADSMTLTLGASSMEFSLLGVAQGLKRLEECFKPSAAASEAAVPAPVVPGIKGLDKEPEEPAEENAPTENNEVGDMIDKAAADALPPAADEPEISKKEEPVPLPEKKEPEPALPITEVKPRDILLPGASTAVSGEGQQMRWRVMKGANLQSIFEVWAQSAQARLVWNAGQGFSVPESLAMQGTFEAVVEAVLSQFPEDQIRPVGKIYMDTAMKQKVLVIETVKPSAPLTTEGNYPPIGVPQ